MSYNSKAFLADRERLLEPDSVIRTGNAKKHQTSQAAKSKWLNTLTPEQREQLKKEYETEQQGNFYY